MSFLSFEKDVFPQLSKNLLLDCFKVDGKMIDVGTRESYIEAHTSDELNWISENVLIGENTNIKNSVIFENCNIGSNVQISNSIILKDSVISDSSEIRDEIYLIRCVKRKHWSLVELDLLDHI